EAARLALESEDSYAIENMLDVAVSFCLEKEEHVLATQSLAAMQNAVEKSGRKLTPVMAQQREKERLSLMEKLETRTFKKAWKDGIALGCSQVLDFVCSCLSSE